MKVVDIFTRAGSDNDFVYFYFLKFNPAAENFKILELCKHLIPRYGTEYLKGI